MLRNILRKVFVFLFPGVRKIRVGIDIDGTLTEHERFFARLSMNPLFEIHIITARDPNIRMPFQRKGKDLTFREWTEDYLKKKVKIRYKKLVMAQNKTEYCIDNDIDIMYENDLEELIELHSAGVFVVCIPNGWDPSWIKSTRPSSIQEYWDIMFKAGTHLSSEFLNKK